MKRFPPESRSIRQRGVALFVALIFLVIITMIAVSAVRFSTTNVRSALNEEYRATAFVNAQSIVDAVISDPNNMPVTSGSVGQVYCTPGLGCGNEIITLPSGLFPDQQSAKTVTATVQRMEPEQAPPPRGAGASLHKFYGANFSATGTYDETSSGQGRTQIHEGLILILPQS